MVWTKITQQQYRRDDLRYASDMRDSEWRLLAPLMPPPSRVGRPREVDLRAVVNAILYIAATGCQWRALPKDCPPRSTVQYYFYGWRNGRIWQRINSVRQTRALAAGRQAIPSAGVIDSQSAKTTESGGPCGFDPAKRGRAQRHLITDTMGLLLALLVHPANIQDNHGAVPLLTALGEKFAKLRHIFADRVYRGPKLINALAGSGKWTIEIINRSQSVATFKAEPKRWVIERTFAWFGRNRRLAKGFEATIESAEAWVMIASVRLLVRRLARA